MSGEESRAPRSRRGPITIARCGSQIVIAALCADGTTEIGNVRQIDRGYERIDERLRALGARIERVEDSQRVHAH